VDLTLQQERILTTGERRKLLRVLRKRRDRIPLQYVLGEVDFFGLTLRVEPGVLIPRPETEGLVDRVLEQLEPGALATIVDVGTGSGAIAIALAKERPGIVVWATDVSSDALRVARGNAKRLGFLGRVRFFRGDLTAPVEGREPPFPIRVLVSNPPYVSPQDRRRLPPEVVDHEPEAALFASKGGTAVIRRLLPRARRILEPGGLLAIEIGEDLGKRVKSLLESEGAWARIRVEQDLAGKDRYVLARRKP
jgi:release factor glutamine methyltransferase